MEIWKAELSRYPWAQLHEASGPAVEIPGSLEEMFTADSPDAVKAAYWKLENHVVVQGQLFNVAPPVVSVLLAALLDHSPSFVRIGILELLFQILNGESHSSEREQDLSDTCRQLARAGLWLLYAELKAELPGQRAAAIEILELIETDASRLEAMRASFLSQLPEPMSPKSIL